MAEYYGFFESIAGRSALHPDDDAPKNLYETVRNHLFLILNTRQGSIAHLPDYGLPDLVDIYKGYPDSLHFLGTVIAKVINQYEPRLFDAQVTLKSSSELQFEANFVIVGYLEEEKNKRQKVVFETTIGQNGRVAIDN